MSSNARKLLGAATSHAEEGASPLEGLVQKATINPGAPSEAEVLGCLAALKRDNPGHFERLWAELKHTHVRMTELGKAIAQHDKVNTGRGPNPTDRLIQIVLAQAELFHDTDGQAYATFVVDDHRETWPVGSKGFQGWLRQMFYLREQRGASNAAIQDAIATIEGKARFDGVEQSVYVRVAELEDRIFIDLCDSSWRAIEVTPEGWRVTSNPPVRFVRSHGMLALSAPLPGDAHALFSHLNVATQDQPLVLGWLIAVMRPHGPYPVLVLQGQQGTAKSTTAEALRSLIDPSRAMLRTAPRSERDLMLAAKNGWVIALDNLSSLRPWLSDALCRLTTGSGLSTRELYTNTEEVIIEAQRPIILNGIHDIATRQDLIDRALVIQLEPIRSADRKTKDDFWRCFDLAKPSIVGGLLDRLSRSLRKLPSTHLPVLPRMADFALAAVAAEPPEEEGGFMRAYERNLQLAIEAGLENSSVAAALRGMMKTIASWHGTATQLLIKLRQHVDEDEHGSAPLPKNAQVLSNQLHRLAPALLTVGIRIEFPSSHGTAKNLHIAALDTTGTCQNGRNQQIGNEFDVEEVTVDVPHG